MRSPLTQAEKYIDALSRDLAYQIMEAIEVPSYFKQMLLSKVQDAIEDFIELKHLEIREYYKLYGPTKEINDNTGV